MIRVYYLSFTNAVAAAITDFHKSYRKYYLSTHYLEYLYLHGRNFHIHTMNRRIN